MSRRRRPCALPVVEAVLAALAVMTATGTAAAGAAADGVDCAAAADEARRARADGHLVHAREQLVGCAERCTAEVALSCRAEADALVAELPTIVVEARDAEGNGVTDASISIDGVSVAQELDGRAYAVDPGRHTVALTRRGVVVTEDVIATAGTKAQLVRATFRPIRDPDGLARDTSGHTVWPWAVVSIGSAIALAGVAVIVTAPSLPAGCDKASRVCTPTSSETAQAFKQRQDQAGLAADQPIVGGAVVAAGALVIAGGIAWHFLESTEPRSGWLSPWFAREGAGLAAHGSF